MKRALSPGPLLVATHNAGKSAEMAEIFAPYGIDVTSAADRGLTAPAETGDTFLENARIKAHAAAAASGVVALADDSGLEVDALGGAPGVHTADWAETGEGRDFDLAMSRVHDAITARGAPQPWGARFRSVLVLAWPDGREASFEGTVEGRIVWPPRGEGGHGYDPVFQPDGDTRTFAEMDGPEKNAVSHRAAALRQLIAQCLD